MNSIEAAIRILQSAGTSLHVNEITERMIKNGLWSSKGKTPEATVGAAIYTDIKKNGASSCFKKVASQTFTLRNSVDKKQPNKTSPSSASAITRNTFINCAQKVLTEFGHGKPMHYRSITQKALDKGWLITEGKTPENTMYALIATEIKRRQSRGEQSLFVKCGRGLFSLSQQRDQGLVIQIEKHNKQVRQDLREGLLSLQPEEFEELIAQLLTEIGFEMIEVTSRSHDGGIDVRGTMVTGDVIRTKMAVQAKKWNFSKNVQKPTVQQVRGSLGAHEQGLIITTSDFSSGAVKEAEEKDKIPIALMNGEQLVKLLMEYDFGVRRTTSNLFELDLASVNDRTKTRVD